MIGQKKRHYRGRLGPQNLQLSFVGLSMVWVGWFGFNAGGAFGATFNTGRGRKLMSCPAMSFLVVIIIIIVVIVTVVTLRIFFYNR